VTTTTKAEQFCHDILDLDMNHAKGLANIIMALGSDTTARCPTQLSESPFFQYHYCIVGKVMKELGKILNGPHREGFVSNLRKLLLSYVPEQSVYKTASDFTMIFKPHSGTLAGRGFVYKPNNSIRNNQPIEIGYYVSCVNLGLYDEEHPEAWSLPLDNQRVEVDADKIALAVCQFKDLMEDADLPFGKSDKVVNMADSGYAVPDYVCPLIASFNNLGAIRSMRTSPIIYKGNLRVWFTIHAPKPDLKKHNVRFLSCLATKPTATKSRRHADG